MNSPAEGRFAAPDDARAERRYRALIEHSREPIGLFGACGELVYANPALQRMLWSEPSLIDLAHPADRDTVLAQLAGLAARPQGRLALKAHFRHHDGSWRMLEAALHNRLQDPDVGAVVASFADIGREVDLEQRFRATFDHAPVGIAHVAEDGRFQLVNRKLCQILGYAREELSALTVFDVSHPEDRDVTLALRRKMRAHELESFSVIKRYLRKDGAAVWAEVSVSLVRAADGAPRYEIAVFEDISARRHAEEALSRSERRFRALIENSSDGIVLTDADGRMTYGSPGTRRTLGYAKGETLGRHLAELVHPEDRAQFERRAPALRVRLRHKDGRYRLLEGTRTDLTADDSVRAVVYNFRDATEREEALARTRRVSLMYAALSAANEVSAQLSDERVLYQRICEIAVQLGGMRLASARLLGPGSPWLETCGCAGEAASYVGGARISVDAAVAEGRGLAGPAMRENRTTVCNDFLAEPRLAPWHEGARRFGFAAVACVPLRRAGAPVGLLILYSAEADYFDAELVTLVERLAANVGHALDRIDGERRLRESEARFRSLANLSSDWSWEQDEELRFTWASPGAEDRGAPVSATLGLRRWEIPEYLPVCGSWTEHRALLEARKPFRDFEYVRHGADGERRYIAIDGEPMFHEDGRFRGYRGTARDITARKLAELGMERLKTLYAALSAANEAILRAQSHEELLSRVCEIGVAAGGFVLGTAFMLDRERGGLRRVAASGAATAYPLEDSVFEDSIVMAAFRQREVVISNDYAADPRTAARRRRPVRFPIGSAAIWPLTVDGEAVGVFALVHAGKGAFSHEMNGLLQGLADNMSFGLASFAHEDRRRRAEERFQMVARATNDVIWDWDLVSDELWWNDNFCAVFRYDPVEVGTGVQSWTARIHPEDAGRVKQDIRGAIERGDRVWTAEYRFRRGDGTYASVFDRGMPLRDAAGRAVRMIGAMVDITERKRAERKLALHAQRQEIIARLGQFALGGADLEHVLAEAARVLRAGGCDVAAIIERIGEAGYEFLVRAARGEDAEASVGKSHVLEPQAAWSTLIESAGTVVHDRSYFETRNTDRPWSAWLRRLGSGVYVPIRGESAAFGILMMGSLRDAAFDAEDLSFAEAIAHVLSTAVRRHHSQTRLAYMAEFDALTGLPNRNLLQDRLDQSVAQARRRHWQGALLFIDLDRFKLINDSLGHHVGDRLIAEVGQRIKQCVRGGDTVGRVSGDEFGVVLTDLAKADDAAIVAQKILDGLARPFDLGGNEAYVTASIGISVFPADAGDAHTLLKNADMAMYRAKELSRNAYCFFTAEMNERSVARLHLNTDLRRAIERGEFALHYQPKVRLGDGSLQGVEALLRWNHPQRGAVAPAQFIPALEDSGLILPVGEWVLGEAARQLAAWQRAGLRTVPVAVNLSARQFRRRDLDSLIGEVLAAHGVPSGLIELEITESCLMDEPEEAVRLLASLRAAGLKISVDDFGTGYSSLSYLTRLPLTALKIDRSFVRDAATSGQAASIVRAVIDMAHNLGFTVIAEGVETDEQVAFLRRHGCDLGQGYLFGRPVPAAELALRLEAAA